MWGQAKCGQKRAVLGLSVCVWPRASFPARFSGKPRGKSRGLESAWGWFEVVILAFAQGGSRFIDRASDEPMPEQYQGHTIKEPCFLILATSRRRRPCFQNTCCGTRFWTPNNHKFMMAMRLLLLSPIAYNGRSETVSAMMPEGSFTVSAQGGPPGAHGTTPQSLDKPAWIKMALA